MQSEHACCRKERVDGAKWTESAPPKVTPMPDVDEWRRCHGYEPQPTATSFVTHASFQLISRKVCPFPASARSESLTANYVGGKVSIFHTCFLIWHSLADFFYQHLEPDSGDSLLGTQSNEKENGSNRNPIVLVYKSQVVLRFFTDNVGLLTNCL